ncbi:MAG: hypothetical protein ABI551_12850 [Polyangiaceae bacterium]
MSQDLLWARIEALLDDAEELQRKKVSALARRLKPGLTDEDLRNPHDFPELADTDWHYEDGILTGIQTARAALRALQQREHDAGS